MIEVAHRYSPPCCALVLIYGSVICLILWTVSSVPVKKKKKEGLHPGHTNTLHTSSAFMRPSLEQRELGLVHS